MRAAWAFLRVLLVALASLASGTLECGGQVMTESQARGQALYDRMCTVCHGEAGRGYAADDAPAIGNPRYLAVASDRLIKAAIADGRSGTTMSAWSYVHAGPLGYRDLDTLVAYLRSLERLPRAAMNDDAAKGDVKHGAATFKARCESCHGERGTTGPYVRVGSADFLREAGNGMIRATITDGREGTLMPAFGRELSASDVDDIVSALRAWQTDTPREVRPPPPKPPPLPLGPVPLHPSGPEPDGFRTTPATTSVDVVERELDRGAKMALLDARAQSDYLGEHIAGAVSVPFFDPDPYFAKLPKDAWLVCYCSCPHAESGQLARKLAEKGFTKVTVLDEGLRVWKSRNYATKSGPDP